MKSHLRRKNTYLGGFGKSSLEFFMIGRKKPSLISQLVDSFGVFNYPSFQESNFLFDVDVFCGGFLLAAVQLLLFVTNLSAPFLSPDFLSSAFGVVA
jgi:hypothetical protein